jgi:predicted extracellular nuclease
MSFVLSSALALSVLACGQDGGTTGEPSGSGGDAGGSGSQGGGGAGAGDSGTPLTILNWNAHNFFNDALDGVGAPEETVVSSGDYDAKLAAIGSVIQESQADIVVLSEIENEQIIADLNGEQLDNGYRTLFLSEGNDGRGLDMALLAKLEPDTAPLDHKDDNFVLEGTTGPNYRYARGCLEAHFTVNGRKVIVLGVHFKSKGPPDDPDKRLAEAQYTRSIADALALEDPAAAIVILGDYNDVPGSPPFKVIEGSGADAYKDSADAVSEEDHYTFVYQGNFELIDHQMANAVLAQMLDPSSVTIRHGAGIDDGTDVASDHAPIQATYLVK